MKYLLQPLQYRQFCSPTSGSRSSHGSNRDASDYVKAYRKKFKEFFGALTQKPSLTNLEILKKRVSLSPGPKPNEPDGADIRLYLLTIYEDYLSNIFPLISQEHLASGVEEALKVAKDALHAAKTRENAVGEKL